MLCVRCASMCNVQILHLYFEDKAISKEEHLILTDLIFVFVLFPFVFMFLLSSRELSGTSD